MAGNRNGHIPDAHARIDAFMRRTVTWQSVVWGRFQELEVALVAGFQNTHARLYNKEVSRGHGLIKPFIPLFSIRDGQEIPGFPATYDEIMALTMDEADDILVALGLSLDGEVEGKRSRICVAAGAHRPPPTNGVGH